jgi:lipoprotein-anchoring transpeptidase ErfK/SrfK
MTSRPRGNSRRYGILAICAALSVFGGAALHAQELVESSVGGAIAPTVDPPTAPSEPEAQHGWEAARRATGRRILVSLGERRLWVMDGDSALFSASIAVGKSMVLEYEAQAWNFATPRGRRRVLSKQKNPIWIPPDWHYVELAVRQGWKLETVRRGRSIRLQDGSSVAVRGRRLGRLLADGSFVPVPDGEEAVFDGTLFVPPLDTDNRRIEGELGAYKLDLGDAYYFHGTRDPSSIGGATTHGCIRLLDDDLEYLYRTVKVGTPVFIY